MPCGVQPTSLERRSNSFLTSRRVARTSVLSPTHSASTLSLLRYLATSTQASFKHRNSQLALSSSYLTSCCRTHDNNPTCTHSTPAQHRAVTGAVFTMCVCAWRASALSYLLMHGRSVMLSQTAHQRVLFGVCGPPGCTSRVRGLLLLATPFSSPIPARHSHAAGPAVRIPCLCMRSPCPLSSPSLDFSPIAFRPASCGARLAPHATFEPDLYDKL